MPNARHEELLKSNRVYNEFYTYYARETLDNEEAQKLAQCDWAWFNHRNREGIERLWFDVVKLSNALS